MNKAEFINQLKHELKGMSQLDIDDIVRDQEEFIREALASGRTEESVMLGLGDPRELAKNLKAEIKIEKAREQIKLAPKMRAVLGALGAVLLLAPFNLIFVLGPLFLFYIMIFSGWLVTIVLGFVSFVSIFVVIPFIISQGPNIFASLSVLFGIMAGVGSACVLFGVMYYVTNFSLKSTLTYLKWNLSVVKKQTE